MTQEPDPSQHVEFTEGLTLEQELLLKITELQARKMTISQLRKAVVILHRELLIKQNYYDSLIKTNWGL